ncbi:MAG: PaaI family thioesterase, partial [Pseudomonadota bacterium]|nr:PaaI family thioesterase [Pseudomonadota bacterium]
MAEARSMRGDVAVLSATAAFNVWAGFEVAHAAEGRAELRLPWRPDLGQYAGFLHAGLIGGMIDTACGFAAFTVSGHVLASSGDPVRRGRTSDAYWTFIGPFGGASAATAL